MANLSLTVGTVALSSSGFNFVFVGLTLVLAGIGFLVGTGFPVVDLVELGFRSFFGSISFLGAVPGFAVFDEAAEPFTTGEDFEVFNLDSVFFINYYLVVNNANEKQFSELSTVKSKKNK